jgi:methylmalonyl-CoA mutase N-terminal domain/subunit
VDPLGGSHAIERITDELEAEATRLIEEVDAMGGMVTAIEEGFPQREIQRAAYRHQLDVESKKKLVVGVNAFEDGAQEASGDILKIDPELETQQVARLQAIREARDARLAAECIDALQSAASGTENLMPHILKAVKSDVSLGEVADALRGVFGKYKEKVVL